METKLLVKSWRIKQEKGEVKTIAGEYEIRLGGEVLATTEFNQGYSGTKITIPGEYR